MFMILYKQKTDFSKNILSLKNHIFRLNDILSNLFSESHYYEVYT